MKRALLALQAKLALKESLELRQILAPLVPLEKQALLVPLEKQALLVKRVPLVIRALLGQLLL